MRRPRRSCSSSTADGEYRRRDRQGPLRLVVRPQRAHRQGRQHLGHRQGLGHDRQVQSGRPRASGCSAAARNRPTTKPKPWEHVKPPLPPIDGMFRQPTDVAWDSQGNIYITDGYINSRVAKYDKNGDWVKSWGTKGTGPGQFRTAARDRDRQERQRLCRRPRQPAHPGVRHRRQVPAHVLDRRAAGARHPCGLRQHADRASGSPR